MVRDFYFDKGIFISFLFLLITGLIFMFSASSIHGVENNSFPYIEKHIIIVMIGFVAMFIAYLIPISVWKKFAYPSILIAIFLLILVLVLPPIELKSGAQIHRWIKIGPFSFQPSEFAKFAIVLFLARFIELKKDRYLQQFKAILTVGFVTSIVMILILIEPHNSGALFIALLVLLIMLSSNFSFKYIAILGSIFIPIIIVGILTNSYALNRFLSVIDPLKYRSSETYQPFEAILAFVKGGFFGEGFGEGTQKFYYLPKIHTDYIYALIGEETGFIGAVIVLILFLYLLIRGISISLQKEDRFVQALGVGITYIISLQAFLHILINLSLFPSTGYTLPFISYGGSSLVLNMAYIGILLRISKERNKPKLAGGINYRKR
ncbi:MAG: FtsW/RodA/SpoVE family cell cycle protein [Aquificae bacterium]|nr:FtsW/RodA/SpoVE family cell cycle protein [Aquificota bacterium]